MRKHTNELKKAVNFRLFSSVHWWRSAIVWRLTGVSRLFYYSTYSHHALHQTTKQSDSNRWDYLWQGRPDATVHLTNYGRLDWLGIDEAGNVYIIETKLLRNPDRRNIIAQLLDYGVALWTEYKDPQDLINYLTSKNINIKQSVLDTFQTSEELADIIIENFKQNIKQWVYQFLWVWDSQTCLNF